MSVLNGTRIFPNANPCFAIIAEKGSELNGTRMTIVRAMPAHFTILTHVGENIPNSFCTRSFSRLSRVGFFSILMWIFPSLSRSKSTWVWSTSSVAARRATVPAVTT